MIYRSSRPEVFCKKIVVRNLTEFTGKHLCQSLFFNKVAGQKHYRTPVNFLKFLTLLFHTEHLWWLLLDLVCFFAKILLHYKTTISNINRAGMTILFSNSSPKIHKSGIFGPKFRHFCFFLWNFANRQIWGCWFKYDNSFFFFNSSPKIVKYGIFGQKYPNKVFLAPNLSIFVSSPDFPIRQIRRSWFQIWQ